MMTNTKKLAIALLGMTALSVGGYALRDLYLEHQQIEALDSDDRDVQLAAILALGEMRSKRALPKLIEIFEREARDSVTFDSVEIEFETPEDERLDPLVGMAPASLPTLVCAADTSTEELVRYIHESGHIASLKIAAVHSLGLYGPTAKSAREPLLRELVYTKAVERRVFVESLTSIDPDWRVELPAAK